jgi:methionyl-tRNA formyltransferase
MGTPQFAVESLKILMENNYNVVGVVTMPDKPAGRGQNLQQSAVKQFALQHNLNILQPTNLKDDEFIKQLKDLNVNLQIVVAFRMLPEIVWSLPTLGTYNLHASLLPKYRGAAPINWSIINGEKETGITTFKIEKEIDTGNILLQQKVDISEEMNAGELHDILMQQGSELILQSVKKIQEGNIKLEAQDINNIKHAPKIFKETCKIDWDKDVNDIHNFIRGLSPYPCAWSDLFIDGKQITFKIYSANKEIIEHDLPFGKIETDGKTFIKIATSGGFIIIKELQMSGKKKLTAIEFLRGFSFKDNYYFI